MAETDEGCPAYARQRSPRAVVDEHHAGRFEAVTEDLVEPGRRGLVGRHDDSDVCWDEFGRGDHVWLQRVDRPGVEELLAETRRSDRIARGDRREQLSASGREPEQA